MAIQLGVVMDPIGSIKIVKDSTFAMLLEGLCVCFGAILEGFTGALLGSRMAGK